MNIFDCSERLVAMHTGHTDNPHVSSSEGAQKSSVRSKEKIMLKDFLSDLAKGLAKFFAGLLVPVCMIIVGAAIVALSFHFQIALLLWIGVALVLSGVVWGFLYLVWHSQ